MCSSDLTELESAQLRQGITKYGRSITSLAKAAGVPQPVLHRFAHGTRTLVRETAQKVADALGLEFVPVNSDEILHAAHDFAWNSLLETEREALELAKNLRATERKLLKAGMQIPAKACSNAAYAQERIAARAREYLDKRLKPYRDRVAKKLAKAKAKVEKQGRGRRSSRAKAVEAN